MTRVIHASYSLWLLILGPLVFVLAVGPWTDKFFPVIDPFVVTTQECRNGECVITGWMQKRRECRFVETYARVLGKGQDMPRMVEIEFMDRPLKQSVTRPTGEQFWGPWRFKADEGALVEIRATHQCNPFWDTRSVIATFEVGA